MTPPPGHGAAHDALRAPEARTEGGFFARASALWTERLWPVIRPHQAMLWGALAMLLVNAGCRLAMPYMMMTAIDGHLLPASQVEDGGDLTGFWWLVGVYVVLATIEAFGRRSQILMLERAGQGALVDLRQKVFVHLQRLPVSFYDKTATGRLVGRVTTDIEALQELFSSGVVTVLGDLIFLAVAVAILLSLSVKLTLVTLLMVPVLLLTTSWIRQHSRKAYTALRERLSQLNGFLHEQVSGMAIVQAFVPVTSFFAFTDTILLAIFAMIALAFLLSVCSEADAFIGRSFLGVMPEPAVLAFLVFGPMFDLKNLLLLRRVLSAREILLLVASLLVAVSVLGVVYASITV
jgi:ABC-type multidrug transport system fused ATPase/permease subunit